MVAMLKAEEQEQQRLSQTSTPKPQKTAKDKTETVGSSCTWRQEELDRFAVTVKSNIDPKAMIPPKFWNFNQYEHYLRGIFPCAPNVKVFSSTFGPSLGPVLFYT